MKCKVLVFMSFILLLSACQSVDESADKYRDQLSDPELMLGSLKNLSDIIVHDIFSPPVASRVYVYPSVAAYEILSQGSEDYNMLAGQLNMLDSIPKAPENISLELAAVYAFNNVGKTLIFSEDKMTSYQENLDKELDSIGIPASVREASSDYAKQVSAHILSWADKDNYKESRSMPKHPIDNREGTWKPTPPAYMEGIEPHWREIRPLVIESAKQFRPAAPPAFDMNKGSDFYQKTKHVYDAVNDATEEHRLIASFWDCNPYVMNQTGHVMIATKKITPGGHWMGIASIAARDAESNMIETTEILTMTSIALFDAFISCWDEKYRSNLIRPETVINEYMDPDWKPILQTPPFPEHTSGHSVISGASAVVLTDILGDNFEFTDDVEVEYGLPVRKFESFYDASDEAAISRLYGGIHYMPAIEDGVKQGRALGGFLTENIEMRKS